MGQGRLSTELGLSFFCCILLLLFVVCWMLAISCVFIVTCVSYGGLGWNIRLIHLHIGVVDHGFMLQGSRGWAWWALGRRKGDEARTSTSFRGGYRDE